MLEGASLAVEDGCFVSLVGPSGSGKSSLLRAIIGLQEPLSGAVETGLPRSQVGILFQDDALLPWKTARDNVALGLILNGVDGRTAREQAEAWLARLDLSGFGDRFPRHLSGGQRKRVALAQVLAMQPKLILMDEPFASLDALTREQLYLDIQKIWQERRKTIVFVTHNVREAACLGDRVVVFGVHPGRIRAEFIIGLARLRDINSVAVANYASVITGALKGTLISGEIPKSFSPEEVAALAS